MQPEWRGAESRAEWLRSLLRQQKYDTLAPAPDGDETELKLASSVSKQPLPGSTLYSDLQRRLSAGQTKRDILSAYGLRSETELFNALEYGCEMRVVDLFDLQPSPEALVIVSESEARRLQIFPFSIRHGCLWLASADLHDQHSPRLSETLNRPVRVNYAPLNDILNCIRRYYPAHEEETH